MKAFEAVVLLNEMLDPGSGKIAAEYSDDNVPIRFVHAPRCA
jgi:hypothetical protein